MGEFLWWTFVRCWPLSDTCTIDWQAWGVAAAGAVGLITVVVAMLAWRTSTQAARIAANQHQDAQVLRTEQARIIGRLLLHEVSVLPARLHAAEKRLGPAGFESGPLAWAEAVHNAIAGLDTPLLQNAEMVEDRIHTLPIGLGADLATLISHARDISAAVRQLHAAADKVVDLIRTNQGRSQLNGAMARAANLEVQLKFVGELAIQFSQEFQAYVLGKADDASSS